MIERSIRRPGNLLMRNRVDALHAASPPFYSSTSHLWRARTSSNAGVHALSQGLQLPHDDGSTNHAELRKQFSRILVHTSLDVTKI